MRFSLMLNAFFSTDDYAMFVMAGCVPAYLQHRKHYECCESKLIKDGGFFHSSKHFFSYHVL